MPRSVGTMTWVPSRLPDQSGRTFVVTGGSGGIGYFTAEQLASTGAHIILASRDLRRVNAAMRSIRTIVPEASLEALKVDLSSLASVKVAGDILRGLDRLDGLILNAGVTAGKRARQESPDGNELTLATNFVGHFALTAKAWPALTRTPDSRVVGLGSLATVVVPFDMMDMQTRRNHTFFRAYGQSKHGMHAFILELDRRAREAGETTSAVLAHPGYAVDSLSPERPGISHASTPAKFGSALLLGAQGKNRGAASVVRALLDPEVVGGEYVGPAALTKGRPALHTPIASSASEEAGSAVWALAERWSATRFPVI